MKKAQETKTVSIVVNTLNSCENLKTLLENEWIYLLVRDHLKEKNVKRYQKGGKWIAIENDALVEEYHVEKEEGLLVGGSSGAAVWAALQVAKRLKKNQKCLVILPDSIRNYLSKFVSDEWGNYLKEDDCVFQTILDISDFSDGLEKQFNGQSIPTERPGHVMREQWHPIGVVGIISAFNFPVAVWSWNTALAWICGDVCVWKASEKAPLCSIACQNIIADILKENNLPEGISCIINGDYKVGEFMTTDSRIPLVSATGSTRMGRIVGTTVAQRFGKSLLELGGNNAIIITPSADLKVVVPGAVFGAVGTCGQRCTSTRRLIIHESVYDKVRDAIVGAYGQLTIGNPLDEKNHIGPLIDHDAVNTYLAAIEKAKAEGGNVLVEGGVLVGEGYESGCYVKPAIIEAENHFEIVQHETFAPILYLMKYSGDVENAIEKQNGVAQGLSSSIMTNEMKEAEKFLSYAGSDCGIANVNIGTSGAEIGGAFGGEKETGGGRESGSDAWKVYMRRQTNTVNYSDELPLAQGIKFDL